MSSVVAVPLFFASLALTLVAARMFAGRLDRIATRFGLPEVLIGLLTALAADGPEISSALVALIKGAHDTGVGVLIGASAFNFATMLGVSALLAGCVAVTLRELAPEGLLAAAITVLAALVLLTWLGPVPGAVLTAIVVVPYALWLRRAERDAVAAHAGEHEDSSTATHHLLALIVVDAVLIIGGSTLMVQSALTLGDRWHVSRALLGVLILGPLASLPNAATGIRLGRAGRAAALVGETFNSNAINLGVGVIIPALFVTLTVHRSADKLQVAWLVAMTAVSLAMLARPSGIRRPEAAVLVAMYAGFVVLATLG